jgi:glycosyltransferase involved in cell wall biosynthesis
MKLCIISHTEHYKDSKGNLVGWGPTITEINHLTEVFDEIFHVAMFYEETPPLSALPYKSDKVTLVKIPVLGGKLFIDKIKTIYNIPRVIKIVNKTLKKVDFFQLRCPTGIGVFLIPYLTFFNKKNGWYKYAGNWNQKKPPLGYFIQRLLLKNQPKKITINGHWKNQPLNCYSFENPTLFSREIEEGIECIQKKNYSKKINFCFVGRLEIEKGVKTILNAFNELKDLSRVGEINFVGDGSDLLLFKEIAKKNNIKIIFHGGLPRKKVFEIFKKSHVFLFPSTASEGFPKVIAEALCFGCVPIVSSVSAIGHYIKNKKNGIVIQQVSDNKLKLEIEKVLNFKEDNYRNLLFNNSILIRKFTYEYYNQRIKTEIIPKIR